jgi:hypothetical protein
MLGLDCLALEGGLLRVGEGVLCLERGYGRARCGLCAALYLSRFVTRCLQLLRFAAKSADFDCAWGRDEIAHVEILSRSGVCREIANLSRPIVDDLPNRWQLRDVFFLNIAASWIGARMTAFATDWASQPGLL